MYLIEVKGNVIVRKLLRKNRDGKHGFIRVTEDQYNSITVPSVFERDDNGNIINIEPADMLNETVIAEAIIDLDNRIKALESILNGG